MEKDKLNKVIDEFNEEDNLQETKKKNEKKVINEREGLIERIDRVLVTNDGRQLLREQY